ncbi:helix-turn-helix domain-containing protein, partial [Streptomyces sp. NPDC001215]
MSQPAKSSRTPATPDAPESAAGSRAAAQRLKMRRELAAAAMELFATKGYEATTVDEIAAAAGVARHRQDRRRRPWSRPVRAVRRAPPRRGPWTWAR